MTKNDKRIKGLELLANISEREYAELDRVIAEAIRLDGQAVQITLGKQLEHIPIEGLGTTRVWVFLWAVNNNVKGMIGWRPYGAYDRCSAFQAVSAKYFADGVKAKAVTMHMPDGTEERLQ
jgi:hypothetical protein